MRAAFVAVIGLVACGDDASTSTDGGGDGAGSGDADVSAPTWVGTDDPTGALPLSIRASREVVRMPAADAPAGDSETTLEAVTSVALERVYWEVKRSETGEVVMTSSEASPVFACPDGGRGTYDVWLRAEGAGARVHLAERRLVTCTLPRTAAGRTVHTVDLSTDASTFYQLGQIDGMAVMPGDVIRVRGAGTRAWTFAGFRGTTAAPIHIINDGPVTNRDTAKLLQIVNCQHLIVDGFGDDATPYGFTFSNTTNSGEQAVFVRNYTLGSNVDTASTDIELFGIHVASNTNTGIEVLTGPGTAAYNRENWVFEHLLLHHTLVENVGDEGFYIGYNNDQTAASGFAPFQIHGAKIYRNVIRNTSWDGLQVANCREGLEVHDNHVSETARTRMMSQRSSFQFNSGNSGWVYRNTFLGAGVDWQSGCTGGSATLFSNVLDRVDDDAGGNAVYVHGSHQAGVTHRFFGNTFVTRNGNGIAVNNNQPANCPAGTAAGLAGVEIMNNVFLFPDGQVAGVAPTPYRDAGGADIPSLVIMPNLTRTASTAAELCLRDLASGDYRVGCAASPALAGGAATIDGATLPLGMLTDHLGRAYASAENFGAHQSPTP